MEEMGMERWLQAMKGMIEIEGSGARSLDVSEGVRVRYPLFVFTCWHAGRFSFARG